VLEDPAGDASLVYALAYSKKPDDVVLGIHYRVCVTHDTKKVKSVEPLSRSALIVKKGAGVPAGAASAGVWGINLVSPTPLETHVYLSLLHDTPVFLGMADHSIWKVDGGADRKGAQRAVRLSRKDLTKPTAPLRYASDVGSPPPAVADLILVRQRARTGDYGRRNNRPVSTSRVSPPGGTPRRS